MRELTAFRSLTAANLRMYGRNPVATFALAAVLLVLLVVMKVVLSGQAPHARVAVVDTARTPESAALVRQVRSAGVFDVSEASPETAARMLARGDADVEIAIPAGIGRRDGAGRPVPARLSVSYRAGSAGEASLPALRGAVESYDEVVLGEVPAITVTASAVQGRRTSPVDSLLAGLVAFNIVGSALMLAAGVFAGYKSTGVLRRLKATGVSATVFVLAHAAATFVVGMVQTVAILVAATLLFDVHLDVPSMFLLLALGYLVFLAMGLAIGGWIRDPQRATAVAQGVAFPMIFVALLAPALPVGVAGVTRYLPVSYLTDGMQRLGQGGQLAAVAPDLAWLAGWAALLLLAAGRAFRWD
jgi:ABC-2 type transport system permease protein